MKRGFPIQGVLVLCGLLLSVARGNSAPAQSRDASPWGMHFHAHRQLEYQNLDRALALCRAAGIHWIRFDFGFAQICTPAGGYNFERLDPIVDRCRKEGIQVLPVLQGYHWELAREHADLVPLQDHLDAWRKYVRATVQHFQGRIRYWSVWNEPDGGFWKQTTPDRAAEYLSILQAGCQEIKGVDPANQVIVDGIGEDFLEALLRLGAGPSFDILALHPYGQGLDDPVRAESFQRVLSLLRRFHCDGKRIWITEGGMSTYQSDILAQQPDFLTRSVRLALARLGRKLPAKSAVALPLSLAQAKDPDLAAGVRRLFPGLTVTPVAVDAMAKLDVACYPVLAWPGGETVYAEQLAPLHDYLARGGLVVYYQGSVPFYVVQGLDAKGTRRPVSVDARGMFRIAFDAWWLNKALPEASFTARINPELAGEGFGPLKTVYAMRYLDGRLMEKGDRYLPIVQATRPSGEAFADVVSLYTYHDWKGGFLVSTASMVSGPSRAEQAIHYPRIYLSYLAAGVDRIFLYDLHDDGTVVQERENNFGILDYHWQPKPAYASYQAMTAALGNSPRFLGRIPCPSDRQHAVWALVFRNGDNGKAVLALWSAAGDKTVTLAGKSECKKLQIGEKVTYIPLSREWKQYRLGCDR